MEAGIGARMSVVNSATMRTVDEPALCLDGSSCCAGLLFPSLNVHTHHKQP